jgi:segregation and condensation protein B
MSSIPDVEDLVSPAEVEDVSSLTDLEGTGAKLAQEPDLRGADGSSGDEVAEDVSDRLGAPSLAAALEALLLMADEPMSPESLAMACNRPVPKIIGTLHALATQYREEGRGFELRDVDDAWRYYTSAECADLVARFVTDGRQARLSKAALETLAIVAYRQPVGRSHVAAVRGVNADGVIRTLLARGLITEVGEEPATGAVLFGTTTHFLDRMGLSSVTELPPIADRLPDMASLDDLID